MEVGAPPPPAPLPSIPPAAASISCARIHPSPQSRPDNPQPVLGRGAGEKPSSNKSTGGGERRGCGWREWLCRRVGLARVIVSGLDTFATYLMRKQARAGRQPSRANSRNSYSWTTTFDSLVLAESLVATLFLTSLTPSSLARANDVLPTGLLVHPSSSSTAQPLRPCAMETSIELQRTLQESLHPQR